MTELNYNDLNKLYSLSLLHIVSKVIALATKMKLNECLSATPVSIDEFANRFHFHPKAMYRFLRVLDAYEIVNLVEAKKVRAGKLLPYLNRLASPHLLDSYNFINDLEFALQDNQECYSKTFGNKFYPHLIDNPEKLKQFQDWCTKSARDWLSTIFSFYDFSKFKTIVDVGGGEGNFLASILANNPQQKGILLDQVDVVSRAKVIFEQFHVNDRVRAIGGDFFDSIPAGGDLYTICRTLLNWNDGDAIKILNNCCKVMNADSSLLIIDFVIPNKKHPQYKVGVTNDLNLLACVSSANRTEEEWRHLIEQSKLTIKNIRITDDSVPTQPLLPMIIIETKAT